MALSLGLISAISSRLGRRLHWLVTNEATANTPVATNDVVITFDQSDNYEPKYSTLAQLSLAQAGGTAGTVTASSAVVVDANSDITGFRNITETGVLTATGGVAAAGGYAVSPRNMHTGGNPPSVSTDFSDYTVVVTETLRAEIFVPANTSSTGVAIMNGSAAAGNLQAYLIDSTGAQVAGVLTASTAQSGTAAYQRIAWAGGPYTLKGPATYYIAVQGNNIGGHLKVHTIGNFGADKQTGTVFGTLTVAAAPTTFTTALGPVATLY
jgi:hypothetical protein